MTHLSLCHLPAFPQAGRRYSYTQCAPPTQAKDPEQSENCPTKPRGMAKSTTPPTTTLARAAGREKGLTWGMIRSSLMYMSCSTPADLREKGRRT